MTIVATDRFKGVVRITEAGFVQRLEAFGNRGLLAERDPRQYYHRILATKDPQGQPVDPLLVLAKFEHESQGGLEGVATQTHSWGNTRLPSFGATPILVQDPVTGRFVPKVVPGASGVFPVYRDWLDGLVSTCARLVTPDYVYTGWGRVQIIDIYRWADDPATPLDESDYVWAPSWDLNNPDSYLSSVLRYMNRWQDIEETTTVPRIHIGLSPGHADTSGDEWGGVEASRTVPLTYAIRDELALHGFKVTLQSPIPFNGGYQDVAEWFAARHLLDPFDCILQCHFEGNDAEVRGAFVVYPDAPERNDRDLDARRIGIDVVNRLHQATGMPIRGDGSLPEQKTNAGRLAWFSRTTNMMATAERMLIEFGASNSNMQDRGIVDAPGFYPAAARAVREAFEVAYGKQTPVVYPPTPPASVDAISFPGTPYTYREGFKSLWNETQSDGSRHLGYRLIGIPRSPEFRMLLPTGPQGQLLERTVQVTERGTLIWNEDTDDPWDLTKSFGEWDGLARAEARKRGYMPG